MGQAWRSWTAVDYAIYNQSFSVNLPILSQLKHQKWCENEYQWPQKRVSDQWINYELKIIAILWAFLLLNSFTFNCQALNQNASASLPDKWECYKSHSIWNCITSLAFCSITDLFMWRTLCQRSESSLVECWRSTIWDTMFVKNKKVSSNMQLNVSIE